MAKQAPPELSERESELLALLATGATNQQIAFALHISVNTVKTHLRNIFEKLGVESRTEAALYAVQHNLVSGMAGAQGIESAAPAAAALPEIPSPAALPWAPTWVVLCAVALLLAAGVGAFLWPLEAAPGAAPANPFVDDTAVQSQPLPASVSGRWQRQAGLNQARARFAQAVVSDTILVIGGLTADGWSGAVEAYTAADGAWLRRADKPTPVANIGAAVVNGLVYIPGGLDASGQAVNIHEVYDPVADAWHTAAPLPRPVCAYAIAPAPGGYYLLGGWDGSAYLSTVYRYDAASDSWSEAGALTSARGFAAAVTEGGRIYLVGGYDGRRVLDLVESFDPAASDAFTWQEHAQLTIPRAGLGLAALNGSLYAVGGGWQRPVATSERYDIAGDNWTSFDAPLTGSWRSLGFSVLDTPAGSFLAAVGGWSDGYLAAVWLYQAQYRVFVP